MSVTVPMASHHRGCCAHCHSSSSLHCCFRIAEKWFYYACPLHSITLLEGIWVVIPGLEFREYVLEIYLGIVNGKKHRGQNDASHFPVLRGGPPNSPARTGLPRLGSISRRLSKELRFPFIWPSALNLLHFYPPHLLQMCCVPLLVKHAQRCVNS